MHVSKRKLGEGYIVGTGLILALVLFGQALQSDAAVGLWSVVWGVPALVLLGAAIWLHRLGLTNDQVWVVAEYSALGLGLGTIVLIVVELIGPVSPISAGESVLLGTTLLTMTVAGSFAGVISSLRQSKRELQRRNAVLNRVLRHNLRNDMTVVLCKLDEIEQASDGAHDEAIQQSRQKIEGLIRLTDKVRRANAPAPDEIGATDPRDVSALVCERVDHLSETYPDIDIETTTSGRALAYVDERFGLVVDNIVESARSRGSREPELAVAVRTDTSVVSLCIEDRSRTLPEADLAAVAAGAETALEHGQGVELWLVDWLVDANDGDIRFEIEDDIRRIVIDVNRATSGLLGD
jgi:K+-sensing histidine kinase KdpD